jgi:hypothetical protein
MQFVNNTIKDLTKYESRIEAAETYENAKNIARQMLGFIDCMITFNNTMICMDNNDFTGEFDEVITDWTSHVYQLLANKAIETQQPHDILMKLLKKRDEVVGA